MSNTKSKYRFAAGNLCRWAVMVWLFWFCRTASAVTIANVTPTGFSVIWRAANFSTPSIAVFADADGATSLAGQVGIEAFPLRTGNPDLAAGYERRLDASALRQKTQGLGWMMMRVSGCRPDTTYYFRLTATPTNGAALVYPVSGALPSVTTAAENTFVANDQPLILDLPDTNSVGSIVLLTHTNAAYPLAAVVGDGVGTNQVFFNVNNLFTLAETGNFTPVGEQEFAVDVLGTNQTDDFSQTYTLTFTTDFATALTTLASVSDEFLALNVGSAVIRAGQSGTVSLVGAANTNLTDINLTFQIPPGWLTNLVLQSLAPQLDPAATTIASSDGSTWQLHFAALSGQTFIGSNTLAELAFTAVSNQTSAFVPLRVTALSGTKSDASGVIRTFVQSGRIVVIADQPLLEAGFAPDNSRQLTLYGKAQTSYAIESSADLLNPSGWNQVDSFTQTGMVTVVSNLDVPSPNVFYRALETDSTPQIPNAASVKSPVSNLVPWTPVQTNSFHYVAPSGEEKSILYRLQRN